MLIMAAFPALAETLEVKGTVTSADDGEPLIGATIRVSQNPSNNTVTDFDGNYSIKVESGQTLIYSYIV